MQIHHKLHRERENCFALFIKDASRNYSTLHCRCTFKCELQLTGNISGQVIYFVICRCIWKICRYKKQAVTQGYILSQSALKNMHYEQAELN